ncbi:hypothetical protein VPH35_001521 [Triticum aestivum]
MESTNEGDHQDNGSLNTSSAIPSWVPQMGMKFGTVDEAWTFWVTYGGKVGFGTRKRYLNPSKFDRTITSCRFVCRKEGHRGKDKRDKHIKEPRAEIRTGCLARMGLTINREAGNYEVTDLVLEHNHIMQLQETCHFLPSQRKISEIQAFEIEIADDSGIGPKAAYECASRRVGGPSVLGYIRRDHKNHLRTKRQRELMYGEAGSMLKYFQDKVAQNPSFQYAIQLDNEEQITNIFWADAKMLIDYAHFGDVVTFDTTFGTNKELRPFGVFVGFNQFRQTVIFGACLLYSETYEAFKWLFETFLFAHNQKHPRTIYTDQDVAMGNAVEDVFLMARHGLCTFHIMQNAIKHLSCHKKEEEEAEEEVEGEGEGEEEEEEDEPHILADFSACMYEYRDKETFEEAFDTMRGKIEKQTWLDSIYKVKEKWAECFMMDAFTLGMRSTQLSESLNNDLKNHLKADLDILRFFKHFERAVQVKRDAELNSEYESRELLPRVKMNVPMLIQASKVYSPIIFESFQVEFERSIASFTKQLDVGYEFAITISSEDECKVIGNPFEQTASCSCGQFERIGILCAHAIKVLDLMNIKLLPEHYILKRWTREARCGTIQDRSGRNVVENPMFDIDQRYKSLNRKFMNLATQVAPSEECCTLLESALDSLTKEFLGRMKNAHQSNHMEGCSTQVVHEESNEHLAAARLKKKSPKKKTRKRKLNWIDKQHKNKKKGAPKKGQTEVKRAKKLPKFQQREDGIGPSQSHTIENNEYWSNQNVTGSNCFTDNYIAPSFTDLVTTSRVEDIEALCRDDFF